MTDFSIPPDSNDALVAQRLPAWLRQANPDRLVALHQALNIQQANAERVRGLFEGFATPDAFAVPLLEQALDAAGLGKVDVRRSQVFIECEDELPISILTSMPFPMPSGPLVEPVRRYRHSVLMAALQNFHDDETLASPMRRGYLKDASGKVLPMSVEAFAVQCRQLDLGGRYQTLLRSRFTPGTTPNPDTGLTTASVGALLEENWRAQLEVAVRMARLKGELNEDCYLQLLPLLAVKPIVDPLPGVVSARQLYLLGKQIQGVVTLEVRKVKGGPLEAVIAWIAHDSHAPLVRHASWQALYEALARRLRDDGFRTFFGRFLSERDRPAFCLALQTLLKSTPQDQVLQLDGRHQALDAKLFAHLRAQQIDKLLDDARMLAVPTGDEEEAYRRARLRDLTAAGLDLLGLAGMFVPVLGEVMLAVAACQIADEVYEGYRAWQLGDRQAALGHLFGVAENVVAGALVGALGVGAVRLARRQPFVDGLVPVCSDNGAVRLASERLPGYPLVDRQPSIGHLVRGEDGWRLRLHEGTYQVDEVPSSGGWSIRHPLHAEAPRIALEHNGTGGWRHLLEQPQHWQGAGLLLRRLDRRLANISDDTAQALIEITGFDEACLRQLHLENAQAPARLLDGFERLEMHEQFPALRGAAFDNHMAERQAVAAPAAALLLRDFPQLGARAAQALVDQASSAQVQAMLDSARVPLALAERARWQMHDARLDRAIAGLRVAAAANDDSERLALVLIGRTAPWPETVRIELRDSRTDGALIVAQGAEAARDVRVIVRQRHGYVLRTGPGASQAALRDSLAKALLLTLEPQQGALLAGMSLDEPGLARRLAELAGADRESASRLLGMVTVGRGLRPPRRFADGRVGYPLSGRGGGSRQAIRRGIHQLFPTLTDGQLDAYLLEVMGRGEGLWGHYSTLQQQLGELRQQLHSWCDGAHNRLEGLRRRRVADTIRRSWRRKLVGLDGEYVLEIDGERVGNLPSLPAGLDFSHVSRLVLRNMDLEALDADFLGRFSQLLELDLRHNRLACVPLGIERLSRLRQLHLQRNQIVIDSAGNQRLSALTRLNTLNLSHNPIGQAPDLSGLRYLRTVSLRDVGLDTLPEPAHRLSWRGFSDLRENRIRQLRQELHDLRVRVQRMSLHDNPLEGTSADLLAQASGGVGSAHAGHADDTLLNLWLGSRRGATRSRRLEVWEAMKEDPEAADLFRFLSDFTEGDDFLDHSAYYQDRVWAMLEACQQHEPLRLKLYQQASGPRTCEDRLLLTLSQMELAVLVEQTVFQGPAAATERRLVQLGRSLFRLDQVDRIASQHVQALVSRGGVEVDEIEVQLCFRVNLAASLDLPAQPAAMHYEDYANVSAAELKRARDKVISVENAEALIASLAQRPFWENYVRERHVTRFEDLAEPYHLRLEALAEAVEQSGEQHYLEQSNALMHELESAERGLITRLAREACARSSIA